MPKLSQLEIGESLPIRLVLSTKYFAIIMLRYTLVTLTDYAVFYVTQVIHCILKYCRING